MNRLTPAQKLIIEKHYIDGMHYDEIAKEIGSKAPAVRKQAQRGVDRIKELVGV